jgi:hypothetical protein
MKKILFLLLFLLSVPVLYGQDQIISRKGYVINCKVIKTEADLVYFDSEVDGVVVRRCIAKSEISKVRYGVGKEQKFAELDTVNKEIAVRKDTLDSEQANAISAITGTEKTKDKFRYYVTAGFNLSTYRGATENLGGSGDFNKYYRFFPVTIGAGVIASMSESVSLQAGVEYVPKGVRFQQNFAWKFGERFVYATNYIETPVSVLFAPSELKTPLGNSYYLRAGIAPAFLVTSKRISKGFDNYDLSSDFKGNNRFDLCTILGIGYRLQNNFMFEVRYEEGSKDLHNNEIFHYEVLHLYNRSVSFTAKYLF